MNETLTIQRHRTAIRRNGLSVPVASLLRNGLLGSSNTLFDYGCGYGQDIELLSSQQITCDGWDPAFRKNSTPAPADVVNLGYVINVIENPDERAEVVRKAWGLARELLVVAAMVDSPPPEQSCQRFSDGIVTSRGTFQKYYSQAELRAYLESTLSTIAVPATPGVFYLFKDDVARELFLSKRFRRSAAAPRPRLSEVRFEQNRDILDPFIETLAQLGRPPGADEFDRYPEIEERLGSVKRAMALVTKVTGSENWQEIAERRTEDLLVYLALSRLTGRPLFTTLPLSVQRDIKAFCGTYQRACAAADALLFSAGDPRKIEQACTTSAIGRLIDNALLVHRDVLGTLEPLLRVYEGCARALVGEVDGAHVIKLHRHSGKVSYLVYRDFANKEHPRLALRVKVTLPTLAVQFFEYSDDERCPPPDGEDRCSPFVFLDTLAMYWRGIIESKKANPCPIPLRRSALAAPSPRPRRALAAPSPRLHFSLQS